MSFLTDWITNIIIFILLATVMDMLLPSSSFQKYAKMVIGLLLITVLLAPIFKLLSTNFEELLASATPTNYVEKSQMENLVDSKKKEIQAAQDAYILEEMAVKLKKDGEEELIKQFNYEIKHIEVSLNTLENPEVSKDMAVSIVLAQPENGEEAIETVKEVEININEKAPEQTIKVTDIKKFLAEQWDIDEEKIEIGFERRGT